MRFVRGGVTWRLSRERLDPGLPGTSIDRWVPLGDADAIDVSEVLEQLPAIWDQVASIMTAHQAMREMGVDDVGARKRMLEQFAEQKAEAVELLRSGVPATEVARRIGLDWALILKWRMEEGVGAPGESPPDQEQETTDQPDAPRDVAEQPTSTVSASAVEAAAAEAPNETRDIYLGRLPFTVTEDEIRDWVERITNTAVTKVYVPKDHVTREPRGFAFITVPAADAEYVMVRLDGMQWGDGPIVARPATRPGSHTREQPVPLPAPKADVDRGLPVSSADAYEITRQCVLVRRESAGRFTEAERLVDMIEPWFDAIVRRAIGGGGNA